MSHNPARDERNARTEMAAAWSHLTLRRKARSQDGRMETVPLPDMARNDLITLAAKKRLEAQQLMIDIYFLERVADEMPGGLSVVAGTHTDRDLADIRATFERRFQRTAAA